MQRDVEIQLGLSQISWMHSRYGLMPRVAMSGLIKRLQGSAEVFDRDPGLRKVLAKLLDVQCILSQRECILTRTFNQLKPPEIICIRHRHFFYVHGNNSREQPDGIVAGRSLAT